MGELCQRERAVPGKMFQRKPTKKRAYCKSSDSFCVAESFSSLDSPTDQYAYNQRFAASIQASGRHSMQGKMLLKVISVGRHHHITWEVSFKGPPQTY